MIQEHHLKVHRTARIYTMGQMTRQTKFLVIACHGYGQLAQHFIRKFDAIAGTDTFVVAPEGLSRFYWGGLSGNAVASWMTKEDRLNEIDDFSGYLTQVYEQFTSALDQEVSVVLFGFSQGCATQLRWMVKNWPVFSHLVLWAGSIPEDIDYQPARKCLSGKSLHFVYGDKDPFITPERIAQQKKLSEQLPMKFREHLFSGAHTIDRKALRLVFDEIRAGEKN